MATWGHHGAITITPGMTWSLDGTKLELTGTTHMDDSRYFFGPRFTETNGIPGTASATIWIRRWGEAVHPPGLPGKSVAYQTGTRQILLVD